MNLQFDLTRIDTIEFGVGKENGGEQQKFVGISVDDDVQQALREMAQTTWVEMTKAAPTPQKYNPSEKHAAIEHLYLPIEDDMATAMKALHTAANLPLDAAALADPAAVYCYFARLTDKDGERLTGLRRATQFKASVKSRFIRLVTDALKLVQDRMFKLDHDFDLLVDSSAVHVLRPSSFEFAGQLQGAILAAVSQNVAVVQTELMFVDFSNIEAYAQKHPRAARYLASIQSQEQGKNVDKRALKALCKRTGVKVSEVGGKLVVPDDQVMGFLEVVDRRRYEVTLVKGSPERFKAASREKLAS
jgi:hypothetical protein